MVNLEGEAREIYQGIVKTSVLQGKLQYRGWFMWLVPWHCCNSGGPEADPVLYIIYDAQLFQLWL